MAGGYFLLFSKFLIALALCVSLSFAHASVRSEYEVKAAFFYNFTQFVSWIPVPDKKLPLRICVLGDNPFGDLLQPLVGRKSQGRTLELANPEDLTAAVGCNVLFVGSSNLRNLPAIIATAQEGNMLTISELPGFIGRGGIIGYVKQGNIIRFEINLQAADAAGVSINSRLLELASRVIQ
ncbi:MAG: hypothetical protein ACI92N_003564 [Pseudomonadales bacterium]|jgi:hypothetical protein|tara:strand:+ start:767 stop:1306 length:540 start_codon:yes stop_codon:yes gene_type:complete